MVWALLPLPQIGICLVVRMDAHGDSRHAEQGDSHCNQKQHSLYGLDPPKWGRGQFAQISKLSMMVTRSIYQHMR